MLKKLFVHEARMMARPLSLLVLINLSAAALLIACEHAVAALDDADSLLALLLTLGLSFLYLLPPLSMAVLPVFCYLRFYKNLFTDEGYLTFTLPVKRHEILNAKLLCTLLFGVIGAVIAGLTLWLCLLLTPESNGLYFGISLLKDLFEVFSALDLISFAIFVFAAFYLNTAFVYLCITLGATILKKGKVVVAILIYYLGNSVLGGVAEVLALMLTALLSPHFLVLSENLPEDGWHAVLSLALLIGAALLATLGSLLHLLTLHIIERKLNLP